jgi:hypothetical protein
MASSPFSVQQLEFAVAFIQSNNLQFKYPNEFWKITATKLHEKFHIPQLPSSTIKNRVMSFLVSYFVQLLNMCRKTQNEEIQRRECRLLLRKWRITITINQFWSRMVFHKTEVSF